MLLDIVSKGLTRLFGSRNERLVKAYRRRLERINAADVDVRALSDEQLRGKTEVFRQRLMDGARIQDVLPEALAVTRQVMDRAVGIRSIFNPDLGFDRALLADGAAALYDTTAQQMKSMDAATVRGCGEVPVPGWMQVQIPVELYDAVRQCYPESRPPFRARPFDVQLIGGMVLWEGKISEMKTGEGKTIVAPLACYLSSLEGMSCYVVTVNDYLVQRDRDWVFPFYYWLGLDVGAIHPYHMQPDSQKQDAYRCDVVYGTNSEFGFDYLRDNMKLTVREQVQRRRDFCIIDEVDSILIDEARTPLIISGPTHSENPQYDSADKVARHLIQQQKPWNAAHEAYDRCEMGIKALEGDIRNAADKSKLPEMRSAFESAKTKLPDLEADRDQHVQFYEVERDKKASHLTHEGIAEAQKVAGIGSFYVGNNMGFPHLLENALRAHAVYQQDRDYVVQDGEVIIVDEFTGRLMIGRQWSDGLHQAVEAKEQVRIKQETQTLATVTIQNYFKLFQRLAGMTGTASTEGTEFHSVYKLDVVEIPTNVPVIRDDRDDLIFLSHKDKWDAILEEIKDTHDVGRPVLVGTTSVENSEMLSQLLTKRYGIGHEVLNAKQHEREAHIVENAGKLGAVMIATNMAGRGTDIKLALIGRGELVQHWKMRNVLPHSAKTEDDDAVLIKQAYTHLAATQLGLKKLELEAMSDDEARLQILQRWVAERTYADPDKCRGLSDDECLRRLDTVPNFVLHRLAMFDRIESMGGLHIVGTERHEARRIDNQLRGRAGRQGDHGSSRFFIALEDDLMKMFAGKTTLAALSKLGWKEGEAIEHKWITKSVERAQRKVEERNYEIRKNLLEYDEVMEYQRNQFYSVRQDVLEGQNVQEIIFDYITESIRDAALIYLDGDYVSTQVSEWCRQTLDVSVEPTKLRTDNAAALASTIRSEARAEVRQIIDVTLGEYMSPGQAADEWDLKGLSSWAMSRFDVDLKQTQLRRMTPDEVQTQLADAAQQQIDRKELPGLDRYLVPHYAAGQFTQWANDKFGIEMEPQMFTDVGVSEAGDVLLEKARDAYTQREITYPVEFVLEMIFQSAPQDHQGAAEQLAAWANQRFEMGWSADDVAGMEGNEIYDQLVAASKQWHEPGRLESIVKGAMQSRERSDAVGLADWARQRFGQSVEPESLEPLTTDERRDLVVAKGREMLRSELTHLERFVLLQILDTAWKDHLYAMDQLKDSVGLRGFAERDPRIEYKREGANLFAEMQATVRDRVTDLIFRAKLTANAEQRSVYGQQDARHDEAGSLLEGGASATAALGSTEQQHDLDAARRAGAERGGRAMSRRQRRAAAARKDPNETTSPVGAAKPKYKARKRRRK